jgi:general secretion pathway protein L
MPMMKNVLGLDAGSHSIKAVELRQTLRGLEPVQMRVHPRTDDEEPIGEAILHFVRMHSMSTEHVISSLPGDRITTRRLEFPFRDRKKLASAVPFEVEGEIPFDLDDVVIDWQLVGGDKSHAEVATIIARHKDVAECLQALAEGGCDPRVLEAEGLVLGNLAPLFEIMDTRLLVDMGHRNTTFCLLQDGRPMAARTIPSAGLALTQAIARDREVDLERAERIKCEEGIFDLGFTSASQGALACVDRVAREALRTLEANEPLLGGSMVDCVAGITLMGGGARLERVDEFLAERTGLPTERLSLPEDPERAALIAGGDPVLFGPAIALALRGTAQAITRLDFRRGPFAYRPDLSQIFTREMRPTAIMLGICLGLFLAGWATSSVLEASRAEKLEKQAAAMYTQLFPDQPVPERPLSALSGAVQQARARAEFLGLYQGNLSALDLMTLLSERVPPSLKVKFEEVAIDRKLVRIKVIAENYEAMDKLENTLKSEPIFAGADVTGKIATLKDGSISATLTIPLETSEEEA